MVADLKVVEKLIMVKARVTNQDIQESHSIGTAVTMSIPHDHLHVRKRCAMWVPLSLTNNNGLGLSGASSCCESLTEAIQN